MLFYALVTERWANSELGKVGLQRFQPIADMHIIDQEPIGTKYIMWKYAPGHLSLYNSLVQISFYLKRDRDMTYFSSMVADSVARSLGP